MNTTHRRTARLVLPALLAAALAPTTAAAQAVSVAPHTARNGALADAPPLVGLAATAWTGPVGFRLGGAIDLPSSPLAPLFRHPPSDAAGAWNGELDLVLNLGRAGLALGSVDPVLLTGFGVHGRRLPHGEAATIPVWSYGGGASVRIWDWLSLDLETRYRMPHESDPHALPLGIGDGWEGRVGMAVHFGSRRGERSPSLAARGAAPAGRAGDRAVGRAAAEAARRGPPSSWPVGTADDDVARNPAPYSARAAALARATLSTADRYVGVPYVWGGDLPARGFDCSGFVRYVFAQHGISLPRVSRDQARVGHWVAPRVDQLQPGDLMFYAGSDGVVNHVAIYAGNNRIIHSSASGRGVRYDDLTSSRGRYYATRMVAARRVIDAGTTFGAR